MFFLTARKKENFDLFGTVRVVKCSEYERQFVGEQFELA